MSTQATLLSFKKLVHAHCGLVLEGIAEDRLHKVLLKSAEQSGCKSLQDYERLIRRDQQRFEQLISELTVNETYFFREPEQIQLLTDVLIPQVLARKNGSAPVRILSAGCSSGEEPYSLLMALQQIYGERTTQLFQVDAGDLDLRILEKARQGIYSNFSFRGVEPHWRERYFQARTNGFHLKPIIRDHVHFYPLNLLAPTLLAHLKNYDIIFFRNVSIYFDTDTRRIIQRKFYDLMQEQSILFLGSSEILGNDLGVFELVEQEGQYFFIKGDAYRPASSQACSWSQSISTVLAAPAKFDFKDLERSLRVNLSEQVRAASLCSPLLAEPSHSTANATPASMPDLTSIQQLMRFGEPQRALRLLDHLLASGYQHYAAYLLKSWILLNNQNFSEADTCLDEALAAEPWSVDGMLLKGLSCKWQNDLKSAQQWFKKVIYTAPECWPAHYYLADINRQQGLDESALKAYQTVMRVLTANPTAGDCMLWVPLPLPIGDVVFLSKRHIQQLSGDMQTTRMER
ncbi:MAG: CheR family methyltransferase [Pseudomonas sp.]|nr:CheR family methyltransferase [Pseudomonas sp.]